MLASCLHLWKHWYFVDFDKPHSGGDRRWAKLEQLLNQEPTWWQELVVPRTQIIHKWRKWKDVEDHCGKVILINRAQIPIYLTYQENWGPLSLSSLSLADTL
jgi:hypothetical protein